MSKLPSSMEETSFFFFNLKCPSPLRQLVALLLSFFPVPKWEAENLSSEAEKGINERERERGKLSFACMEKCRQLVALLLSFFFPVPKWEAENLSSEAEKGINDELPEPGLLQDPSSFTGRVEAGRKEKRKRKKRRSKHSTIMAPQEASSISYSVGSSLSCPAGSFLSDTTGSSLSYPASSSLSYATGSSLSYPSISSLSHEAGSSLTYSVESSLSYLTGSSLSDPTGPSLSYPVVSSLSCPEGSSLSSPEGSSLSYLAESPLSCPAESSLSYPVCMDPFARAPGSSLTRQRLGMLTVGNRVISDSDPVASSSSGSSSSSSDSSSNSSDEEFYVYDIWGNHFAPIGSKQPSRNNHPCLIGFQSYFTSSEFSMQLGGFSRPPSLSFSAFSPGVVPITNRPNLAAEYK